MKKQQLIAAGSLLAVALSAAPALAAASGPQVSVRVEGLNATVLPAKSVTLPARGSITKNGVKSGLCPADSAQGALQSATGGRWKGTWYASDKEYFVTGILGNTPNAKTDYYEIFVNNVAASSGACEIKLKAGAKLLFAAVPDTGKAETPLAVTTTSVGAKITAKVVGYSAKGTAAPLKGATLKIGTATLRTGANGTATFSVSGQKPASLVASARGYIRDEITVVPQSAA